MFHLARCYSAGIGVNIDAVKGARWYKESAKMGCPDGMFAYSLCIR
jgi:TPR repeat protein